MNISLKRDHFSEELDKVIDLVTFEENGRFTAIDVREMNGAEAIEATIEAVKSLRKD